MGILRAKGLFLSKSFNSPKKPLRHKSTLRTLFSGFWSNATVIVNLRMQKSRMIYGRLTKFQNTRENNYSNDTSSVRLLTLRILWMEFELTLTLGVELRHTRRNRRLSIPDQRGSSATSPVHLAETITFPTYPHFVFWTSREDKQY